MFYALKLIGFVVGLEIASYEVTFLLSSDLIELITSQQFCSREAVTPRVTRIL